MKDSTKGTIYAVFAVLLFATMGTGFKLSVARLDGYSAAVYMGLFSVAALLVNLLLTGKAAEIIPEFRRRPRFFILTGILGLGLQQLFCIKSYEQLPAAQVVMLTYSYPLMMIVLARLVYQERFSLRSLGCLLMGFVGVVVLICGGTLQRPEVSPGVFLSLGCAFSFALFCVLIKHARFDVSIGMFLFNLFGLVFLLLLLPCYGLDCQVSASQWLVLLYLGVFPTAVAFVLWNRALQLTKTSHSSNIALLTPVLSLICIAIILRERVALSQLTGMAIILGSVFLNMRSSTPVPEGEAVCE